MTGIGQLHVCENGSAIYADAQALAVMNAAMVTIAHTNFSK